MIKARATVSMKKGGLTKKITDMVENMRTDIFKVIPELTPVAPVNGGTAKAGWKKTKEGTRNDVIYIGRLDRGHSKQAKNGMTKPALDIIKTRAKKS
mgnify:FL=1